MIPKGATGAAAEMPFDLVTEAGAAVTDKGDGGNPWNDVGDGSTDELKVQLPDAPGTDVNAVITQIVNRGGGRYGYQLAAAETDAEGIVAIYPNISGVLGDPLSARWDRIIDIIRPNTVMEANAHAKARTFVQRERIAFSALVGDAPEDLEASPYYFRDRPGATSTKDRAAFTMVNGVRTATDLDGDE